MMDDNCLGAVGRFLRIFLAVMEERTDLFSFEVSSFLYVPDAQEN